MRAYGQAERVRVGLPLRGAGERLWREGGTLLSLSLSRTAAARDGSLVRRRRRTRRAAWLAGDDPGDGGGQTHSRSRRSADWPLVTGGCPGHAIPSDEDQQGPGVPALRTAR